MNKTMLVATLIATSSSALAVTVPFTETFDSAAANWSTASAFSPLTYFPAGGPDGSAYGSMTTNFAAQPIGAQPIFFRGQSNFNSSGNAFVGDWIASGVTQLTFAIRHDGVAPMDIFARFAPAAGPGAVAPMAPAVLPNQWTTLTLAIDPSTFFIYEGTTFNSTFSNVARIQFGAILSGGLAGQPGDVHIDIDNVGVVPAPGAGAAALMAAGLLIARRRR